MGYGVTATHETLTLALQVRVLLSQPYLFKKGANMTKGQMIKALHSIGIRSGDRDGVEKKLQHLRYFEICRLYYDNIVNKNKN